MSHQFSKASLSCVGFVGECLGVLHCLGEPHPPKARLKSTQRPVTLVYGSRLWNLTGREPRLAPRHLLESLRSYWLPVLWETVVVLAAQAALERG